MTWIEWGDWDICRRCILELFFTVLELDLFAQKDSNKSNNHKVVLYKDKKMKWSLWRGL